MNPLHNQKRRVEWVESINSTDVLFGRGHHITKHPGNKVFRKLIKERKAAYNSTKHRQTKTKIAQEIITSLQSSRQGSPPPRFLRKATAKESRLLGIPYGAWCIVNEKDILDKTKHSLRREGTQGKKTPLDDQGPPTGNHEESVATTAAARLAQEEETESLKVSIHKDSQGNKSSFDDQRLPRYHSSTPTNRPTNGHQVAVVSPETARTPAALQEDLLMQEPMIPDMFLDSRAELQDEAPYDNQDYSGASRTRAEGPEATKDSVPDENNDPLMQIPVVPPDLCFTSTNVAHPPAGSHNHEDHLQENDWIMMDW